MFAICGNDYFTLGPEWTTATLQEAIAWVDKQNSKSLIGGRPYDVIKLEIGKDPENVASFDIRNDGETEWTM